MSGVNKVILVGNVGKDPEVRYLEGGVAVARFPLATTEVYKNREGQKVEQTEWHNIVLWRGLAEIAEKYIRKGKQLYIEGRIRTRTYEENNVKKYFTEIQAEAMTMLGGGEKVPSAPLSDATESKQPPVESVVNEPDGLPF